MRVVSLGGSLRVPRPRRRQAYQTTGVDGSVTLLMYDPMTSQLMATIQKMDGTTVGDNPATDRKTLNQFLSTQPGQYFYSNGSAYTAGTKTTIIDPNGTSSVIVHGELNGGLQTVDSSDGLDTTTSIIIIPGTGGQATVTTTNPDGSQLVDQYANQVPQSEKQKGTDGSTIQSDTFGYDGLQRNNSVIDSATPARPPIPSAATARSHQRLCPTEPFRRRPPTTRLMMLPPP